MCTIVTINERTKEKSDIDIINDDRMGQDLFTD